MPAKLARRTLSKVEQQIQREKEEAVKFEKQKKHREWLARQQKRKQVAKPVVMTNPVVVAEPVVMLKYWKCLNNSWADQTEFEDSRKKMLKRMAFKMLIAQDYGS